MARESGGLTLKEKREGGRHSVEEMIILIAGEGDQRSFKLSSCGAKILTGDNRFQKWAAHGGRIVNPLVCLSFPFFLIPPHLPPSPPPPPAFPSSSLPYFYPRLLLHYPFLFPLSFSPFFKKIRRAYNKPHSAGSTATDLTERPFPSWPFHTSPLRPIRALSAPLVSLP